MKTQLSAKPAATTLASDDTLPIVTAVGLVKKIEAGDVAEGVAALPMTATGTTTARSTADRFGDFNNVKDFGATGDGETDDTAAITAAILASVNRVLYFPAGVYLISTALPIVQGIKIEGEGAGGGYSIQEYTANPSLETIARSGQAVIFMAANSNCPMFTNEAEHGEFLRETASPHDGRGTINQYTYNAEFSNIVLHGNARSQSKYDCDLFDLLDGWGFTFKNVQFLFPAGYFIRAWNCNVVRLDSCIYLGDNAKSKGILFYDTADSLVTGTNMGGGVVGPFLWVSTPSGWLNNINGAHFGDTQNVEVGGIIQSVADNVMTLSADPRLETGDPFVFHIHPNAAPGSARPTEGQHGITYFYIRIDATHGAFSDTLEGAMAGTKKTIATTGTNCYVKPGPSVCLYLNQSASRNSFVNMRWDNGRDGCIIIDNASHNIISGSVISKPGYNGGTPPKFDYCGLWITVGSNNIISDNVFTDCVYPIRVDSGTNYFGHYTLVSCTNPVDLGDDTTLPLMEKVSGEIALRNARTFFDTNNPGKLNVKWSIFGAVGDGETDDTAAIQAAIDAAIDTKTSVHIPSGIYLLSPFNESVAHVLICGYSSYPAGSGVLSATNTETPRQDSPQYGSLLIEGDDTGKRLNRVDIDQTFTKGAVLKFTGDMDGHIGIATGHLQRNVRLKNLTLIGTGQGFNSIGIRHNVYCSNFELENSTLQHWGVAVDVGGDWATVGDAHADYNTLRRVSTSYCKVGVRVNNYNAYITSLYDCDITAMRPVENLKAMAGVTPSPRVNIFGGFYAPVTDAPTPSTGESWGGAVVLAGLVTAATSSTITFGALTKYRKVRDVSNDTVSIASESGSASGITTDYFAMVEKDCVATGNCRVPDWGVMRRITAINTGTSTITVEGAVNTTEIVGQRIFITLPACAFYGDHFNVNGAHVESIEETCKGVGSMVWCGVGWGSTTTFTNILVNLYQKEYIDGTTLRYNAILPLFFHLPLYGFHGFQFRIQSSTLKTRYAKLQVTGSHGVRSVENHWLTRPLFLDHTGVVADGVIREGDAQFCKCRTEYGSGGLLEMRANTSQFGKDRYEQAGGLLKRPRINTTSVPTAGCSGEIFEVISGGAPSVFRIASVSSVEGYFDATAITASGTISLSNPTRMEVDDLSELWIDRVISIAEAGPSAAAHVTRIMDIVTDGVTRYVYLKDAASSPITSKAISAVAPSFAGITMGKSEMTVPALILLGGASGNDIQEWARTNGTIQSFVARVGAGTMTLRDKTNAKDCLILTTESDAIRARFPKGFSLVEQTDVPGASTLTSDPATNPKDRVAIFMKNDKLVVAYNNAGVVTYLSIPLDASTTTWTQSTSTP